MSVKNRRKALTSAVDEYGASMIIKKLNALRVYQRNKGPESARLFYNDMRTEIKKNKDSTLKVIEELAKKKPCKIEIPLYRISHHVNYIQLKKNIRDLLEREGF